MYVYSSNWTCNVKSFRSRKAEKNFDEAMKMIKLTGLENAISYETIRKWFAARPRSDECSRSENEVHIHPSFSSKTKPGSNF